MRNNIFGYIFVLFIIGILGFAIYKVKVQNGDDEDFKGTSVTSSQEVQKGTEMTLAISEFDTINPIITNNRKVQDIDRIVYEPLIGITEDFKLEYILAVECANISANTYVIKLRQGVKWSDGTKFTSDDVKYTIDRIKENDSLVYFGNVAEIQEINIIDNYTIKLYDCNFNHITNNIK